MHCKPLQDTGGRRTFVVVFGKDDEVVQGLLRIAAEQGIRAAAVQGIGGFREVTLGYFDRASRTYRPIRVREQVEVMSLLGNISVVRGGEVKLHLHAVIGQSSGAAMGGHLLQAHVWPTLEVFLTVFPGTLERVTDEETSLPLLDVSA